MKLLSVVTPPLAISQYKFIEGIVNNADTDI